MQAYLKVLTKSYWDKEMDANDKKRQEDTKDTDFQQKDKKTKKTRCNSRLKCFHNTGYANVWISKLRMPSKNINLKAIHNVFTYNKISQ